MQCDTLLRINSFDNYTTSNSFHQGVNIQIKFTVPDNELWITVYLRSS